MEFIFSKKIFQLVQFVHGAIKYFFLFFFFLISAFIVEISSILKYQKRKASTASKIIEIFIHFQSRFPTNVFFLKAMLS